MGETIIASDCSGEGIPIFSADTKGAPWNYSNHCRVINKRGSIVVGARGSIGNPRLPDFDNFAATQTTIVVTPNFNILDSRFLFYTLSTIRFTDLSAQQAVPMLTVKDLGRMRVSVCPLPQQRRIAEILSTVDEAIERTEQLIAKQRQIKAGLMADLFTRGITPEGLSAEASAKVGHLRPPPESAPHLYKDSPLGKIPKEWEVREVGDIVESLIDGPFGSNLKSEHYVTEPGIRVVRLQNIKDSEYNDTDRAFIAENHALFLIRHTVVSGDVLIAGLGDDSYPVGRACCYPMNLPSAVNKADCFRLRCKNEEMLNSFMMYFLNTENARRQIRKYEQGVTRKRINGGNVKRLYAALPSIEEQHIIVSTIDCPNSLIDSESNNLTKLNSIKQGLMQDLLTGRVSANP